ncbi:MAG: SUMF1/EgtB/PvdO family nonheme iron enzyme [Kiloniellales bacterium]|nr:SUMF1/EgtB/PvdO family nonheme iron enzyme [Kiloniellales bacterium]
MTRKSLTAAASLSAIALATVILTASDVAADGKVATSGAEVPAEFELAQALLAIEQINEIYRVPEPTPVYQRPDIGSDTIDQLPGDSSVRVTGRVTGTDWLRIWSNNRMVGYVEGARIQRPGNLPGSIAGGVAPSATQPATQPAPQRALPGRQTAALTPGPTEGTFRDCTLCPEMVALPPGGFLMGSDLGDATAQPARPVEIGYSFALGRFEVTMAEWAACVADGGCSNALEPVANPAETPVRNVTWNDGLEFVAWLRKVTQRPYRLPSEAEWEYAARAGTTTNFWWGNTAGAGEADCKTCGGAWDRKQPSLVGRFPANPFGLHDMNGGVAEWTADCWFDSYKGAKADGQPRDKKDCQKRVLRGGSWKQEASYLSSHARHFYDALVPYSSNGLRVALTLQK